MTYLAFCHLHVIFLISLKLMYKYLSAYLSLEAETMMWPKTLELVAFY